jgi:hypothetical protein
MVKTFDIVVFPGDYGGPEVCGNSTGLFEEERLTIPDTAR